MKPESVSRSRLGKALMIGRRSNDANRLLGRVKMFAVFGILASCSPGGIAGSAQSAAQEASSGSGQGLIFVHCVGRTAEKRPEDWDAKVTPFAADYALDSSSQQLLAYSIAKQVIEPVNNDKDCVTEYSNKLAEVKCSVSSALPEAGTETANTDTRLDRVLGTITVSITDSKRYQENWRNTTSSFAAQGSCVPGDNPISRKKF